MFRSTPFKESWFESYYSYCLEKRGKHTRDVKIEFQGQSDFGAKSTWFWTDNCRLVSKRIAVIHLFATCRARCRVRIAMVYWYVQWVVAFVFCFSFFLWTKQKVFVSLTVCGPVHCITCCWNLPPIAKKIGGRIISNNVAILNNWLKIQMIRFDSLAW